MIQDINETYDNTYHRYAIEDKDAVLIYKGFSVLTKKAGNGTVFPSFSEAGGEPASYIYLFSVGEKRFFIPVSGEDMTVKGYDFTDLRSLFDTDRNSPAAFAAVTGMQLNNWYEARRYCGRCGSLNVMGDKERTLVCPDCGLTEYPKISPCVIIGITDGDRIVMTKYAEGYDKFALVAGFCEIGESFEAAIRREVMEEVGLKVKNITYYDSQPWSYSDSLLAGFFCEVDGDRTITVDGYELKEAGWYTRDEVPDKRDSISLTGKMMDFFKHNDIKLAER